jgi:hypothetical protein
VTRYPAVAFQTFHAATAGVEAQPVGRDRVAALRGRIADASGHDM